MISDSRKDQIKRIVESCKPGGVVDCEDFSDEEIRLMSQLFNAKSKEKEYTMDKYLVIVEDGFAIGCTELKDAKDECQKAIGAGVEEVFIYERKLVASQVKPKVEFKEV